MLNNLYLGLVSRVSPFSNLSHTFKSAGVLFRQVAFMNGRKEAQTQNSPFIFI